MAESWAGAGGVSSTQVTGETRRPARTLEIYRGHAVSAKGREDSSRRGERPWDFLVLGSGGRDGPPDGWVVGQFLLHRAGMWARPAFPPGWRLHLAGGKSSQSSSLPVHWLFFSWWKSL